MNKLSQSQFERAAAYLRNQARPLERALFEHYFENQPADPVYLHLAAFQNPDGGFGKALEPDMRSPSSSALATENGLRLLVELKTPAGHPMVCQVLLYLQNALEEGSLTWRVVPPDVNDHPHAPWWHDADGSLENVFGGFRIIPRAGILAALVTYKADLPEAWLDRITTDTLAHILGGGVDEFGGGGDALVYARRLAEAPGLPPQDRERLVAHVAAMADAIVARQPEQWSQYCAPPLKLAPTPQSVTAPLLQDCLPAHLDYLVAHQDPQGYWDVTWAWGEYPDVWPAARQEWRGVLTLDALLSLRAYGWLE
jgi:hypothetical protein